MPGMTYLRVIGCAAIFLWLAPPRSGDVYLLPGVTVRQKPPVDRTYLVATGSRAFVHLTVGQHDSDVAVTSRVAGSPASKEIDCYEYGDEPVSVEARAGNTIAFHVHVNASHATGAFYTLTLDTVRTPAASDALWMEGERIASDVKKSLDEGPPDTARLVEERQRAGNIWRQLNAPTMEASAVVQTGNILFAGGRINDALAAYLRALELSSQSHDAGNRANLPMTRAIAN